MVKIPTSEASSFIGCRTYGLLLFIFTVAVYLPSLKGAFVWDDVADLAENPCIVGPLGLGEIWTSAHASLCPLVLTTFWLEYHGWGLEIWPYHLVNILMHAAAGVVLWRVLLRLGIHGAWLGAALWSVHPVQVESVAWITELKNTQSGLFFLLAVLFFCRSRRAHPLNGVEGRCGRDYFLALVFAALALASKSSTVVLPLVLALCAWWMDGCWRWRRNLLQLSPLLLMATVAGAVTIWTQKIESHATGPEWTLTAFQRLAVAGRAVWFYLGKLAWPHPLVIIYPRWSIADLGVADFLPAVAVAAMFVLLAANRNFRTRGRKGMLLAWSYFVAALLPVLGLLDHNLLGYSFVFDHFQYLASMGPLALAAAGITVGMERIHAQHRWKIWPFSALVLLGLGTLTWRQCAIFRNEEVLWSATLSRNPSCWAAHNNLGLALARKGDAEGATTHFEKAVELSPSFAEAHNNLGNELRQKGWHDDAVIHFKKAIEIDPGFGEAHYNLANELQRKGNLDEAIAHYQKVIEITPNLAEGHNNLGLALQKKGRLDDALAHYQKAIKINSRYPEAYNNLGTLYGKMGHEDDAVLAFQKAVEIRPGFAEAQNNLGLAYERNGKLNDAATHFQRATQSNPDFAEAYNNLGIVRGKEGRFDEAMAQFQKAIEDKPDFAEAHYNFGLACDKGGRPADALPHFQKAIEINPDYVAALLSLAHLLATCESDPLRDGSKAVQLAQRANKLTGGTNPMVLGTIAAAQAEAGSFSEAVETARQAIHCAETQKLGALVEILQQQQKLYESGHPLRAAH